MDTRIEVVSETDLPHREAGTIAHWALKAFEEHGGFANCVWAPADWRVLVYADGQLVTFLKVTERVISVGDRQVKVGGMGDLITLPEWRGKGLASLAMQHLDEELLKHPDLEFGVLMCVPALVPYYSRFGWQAVPEPIVYEQAWGKETSPEVTMVLPLRGQPWPAGPIDIMGLPW